MIKIMFLQSIVHTIIVMPAEAGIQTMSIANDLVNQLPFGATSCTCIGILPTAGRAAQARVKEPDAVFDAVQHAFTQSITIDISVGRLLHGAVHRQVVLAGGDDHVDLLQDTVFVQPSYHGTRYRGASLTPNTDLLLTSTL